jgi:imidazoleglycerol-phosphate dehydratase
VERETGETRVRLTLARGPADTSSGIATTDAFLDHMLATLARHAGLVLHLEARGDLRHHLVEDVAITLGLALRQETPALCARYGHALIPMDDALVEVAIDAGGRAWYEGNLPSRLYEHFLRSLATNAGYTIHLRVLRGRDRHHVVEAAMKAMGLALRQALAPDLELRSTKGPVRVRREE